VVVGSNNYAHDICAALWENDADVTMVQRTSAHVVKSDSLMELALGDLYSERAVAAGITTEKADTNSRRCPPTRFEDTRAGYPRVMTDSNTHSNGRADDSQELLGADRAGETGTTAKDPDSWVTGDEPMTGAQRSYLDTLAREAGEQLSPDLTKAEASEHIDRLQSKTGRGQG
jgi:cation diffusion facilitator CzcD-associated flavoprotein CzcO